MVDHLEPAPEQPGTTGWTRPAEEAGWLTIGCSRAGWYGGAPPGPFPAPSLVRSRFRFAAELELFRCVASAAGSQCHGIGKAPQAAETSWMKTQLSWIWAVGRRREGVEARHE